MAEAPQKAAAATTTMGPCKSKPGTSTDAKTTESSDVTTPKNDVTDNNATADGAVNSEKRMVENLTEKLLDSWIADAATKALEKSEPATSESFSVSHFESDDDVIKDYDVVINDECYDEEEQRQKELLEEEIDDMDYDLDDDYTKDQNDVTTSNEAGTPEISNPAPAASVQNEFPPVVVKTDDVKTDVGASGDVDAAVDLGDVTAAAMPDVADVIKALQGGMGAPQDAGAGAAGAPEPDPEETLETEEWYYSDDSDFDPPTSMSTGQIAAENMRAQMSGTVDETDDQNTSTETTSDSGAQEAPQDDMVQKKNLENLRTGTEDEVTASIAKETKAETQAQEIENESKTAPTSTADESGMASTSADESAPSAADKPKPVVGELSSTEEALEKSTENPEETSPKYDEKSGSLESRTNKCEEEEKPNENSKPEAPRATLAEIEARLNSAQQIMKKSEEKPRENSSKEYRETAKSPENKPTASTTADDNNKNDESTKPTEDLNSDSSRTSMADIEARLNSVKKVSTDLNSSSINEILYGSKPNNYVSHYNGLLKLQMDIGRIQRCMSEMQGQIRALSRTVDTMIENVEGDIGISE